jgi:predicted alpha/beta superfamily hydrolase
MKKVILLLMVVLSYTGNSQKVSDSVFVKSQNLFRELTVSLPPSYKKDPKRTYPLLFLLDGDYLFDPFEGTMKYGYYWDDLPEVILVGLSQDKERDADCTLDEATGLPEGSGADFFEFIGGELMPYLQKKYRISPFKIIAGHDVTASFLNLYLYKDAPLFNAYISLSPELGLEMETRIAERLAGFKQNIFYYQSSSDGDIKKMKEKITTLDTNIKAVVNPSLNYKYDDFKEASHYSLVLYSIPSALYQIFASYQPISTTEFQEKIVKLESGYVTYLKNKYDILEKVLNIKLNINKDQTMLCKFIASKVERANIIQDNTPHSVAAGIIYFVCQTFNMTQTKGDFATICKVSEVTISKCYRKLESIKNDLIPPCLIKKIAENK